MQPGATIAGECRGSLKAEARYVLVILVTGCISEGSEVSMMERFVPLRTTVLLLQKSAGTSLSVHQHEKTERCTYTREYYSAPKVGNLVICDNIDASRDHDRK